MGWYDAYKGNTARVNLSGMTSNKGSAASSLGDAFKDIGKSIYNSEIDDEKSAVLDLQKQNEQNKIDAFKSDQEQKAEDWVQQEDNKDYLNAAWGATTRDGLKDSYPLDGTNSVDAATLEKGKKIFDDKEKFAQNNFNDEAISLSLDGAYKSFDKFKIANPTVVQNADGITLSKIDKNFRANNNDAASIVSKTKDLKQQQALFKKDKEIVKLMASKESKEYKYSEKTDKDIVSLVKSASGFDAPDFSFSDTQKISFQNEVSGASAIAKKYNLMPTLAVHIYNNPDSYDFTADGKVLVKKETPKKVEKKTNSWKDYQ